MPSRVITLPAKVDEVFNSEYVPAQVQSCHGIIHCALMENGTHSDARSTAQTNVFVELEPVLAFSQLFLRSHGLIRPFLLFLDLGLSGCGHFRDRQLQLDGPGIATLQPYKFAAYF